MELDDQLQSPWIWLGPGLPGLRHAPEHATYADFRYDSLPSLPGTIDEGWRWLQTLPRADCPVTGPEDDVLNEMAAAGLAVPSEMLDFYSDPALCEHVESITACWTDFSAFDAEDDHWLVLFLRDQQDVLFWLVHLLPGGGHQVVVCAPEDLESWNETLEGERVGRLPAAQQMRICAGSFREFVYRYAVENALWTSVTNRPPRRLTDLERAYVERYPRNQLF